MYYTALISMVLVLFLFLKDKKLLTKSDIQKRSNRYNIDEIEKRQKHIKENIKCMFYTDNINIEEIDKEYVLMYREDVALSDELLDDIYLNYIIQRENPCVFSGRYIVDERVNVKNKFKIKEKVKGFLYSNLLNYICIFDKDNIDNYFIIILKKEELESLFNKKISLKDVKSFDSEKICINIKYGTKNERRDIVEKYLYGIRNMSIKTTVRIGLFIFTASTVTVNLLNNIINLEKNIYAVLVSVFMYYCYSIVTRYIFKSVGKLRYIAPYLFPVYVISYIITYIYIVIDKKHIS